MIRHRLDVSLYLDLDEQLTERLKHEHLDSLDPDTLLRMVSASEAHPYQSAFAELEARLKRQLGAVQLDILDIEPEEVPHGEC